MSLTQEFARRMSSPDDRTKPANPALKQQGFNQMTLGAYAPQSTAAPDLSRKAWEREKEEHEGRAWKDSPQGRLAIRAFSRGILGAAFFTIGGLLTKKWMFEPHAEYNPALGLGEQQNPLKFIAKLLDTTVGKPIEVTVNMLGGNGKQAVRFRPTRYNGYGDGARGRSLGAEVVGVTFDFFCASIGDAFGRDIAGWFDPNVKKDWMKDGRVDIPAAIQSAARTAWRYATYNGGEDWAVAIPYVYYMKGQRHLLNRFSPGFAYDSDRNLNGASFKVNNKGHVVGNYSAEGAVDFQGRFTAYNIGTLMYREIYNNIADRIAGRPTTLYGTPWEQDPSKQGIMHSVADVAKWAVRSAVKATIYMTPTVPFFWITRVPQGKHRGLAINPEKGVLSYRATYNGQPDIYSMYANDVALGHASASTPTFFSQYHPPTQEWHRTTPTPNPFVRSGFDPHGATFGPFDRVLNAAGKFSHNASHTLDPAARWLDRKAPSMMRSVFGLHAGDNQFSRFTRPFVHASLSYTPYMYVKAETARAWDSGKMDMAIERAIEGASRFNWSEFKAGCAETWRAFRHQPFADPAREAQAQDRIDFDTSPPDTIDPRWSSDEGEVRHQAFLDYLKQRKHHAKAKFEELKSQQGQSYAERVKPKAAPEGMMKESAPRVQSFVAQEALRQDQDFPTINTTIH